MPDATRSAALPSAEAVDAALAGARASGARGIEMATTVGGALKAAYPIIRADVIAEVVAALRGKRTATILGIDWYDAADFVERKFAPKPPETLGD